MMANAIAASINKSTPDWIVARLGKPTNGLPTIHVEKLREARTHDPIEGPITMLITAESITIHSLGGWLASAMRETMFVPVKIEDGPVLNVSRSEYDPDWTDPLDEPHEGDEWLHEPSHERMVSRS